MLTQASGQDRLPNIIPLEFWIEYKPQSDGSMKEEERVKWIRRGTTGSDTSEAVFRLQRENGPIWQTLKPYYDHWKAGVEAPLNGTPLAAWPGATPHLVKALASVHIKTVEDLANIEESVMNRIAVPGMRGFKTNAQAFVQAQKSTAIVAGEIAELRQAMSAKDAEIDELKELIKELASTKGVEVTDDESSVPAPRRGRPRKVA